MHYGCAWYPEHRGEATWAHDLRLMRDAGMTVVRIAEFAWSRLEPADGRFAFAWVEAAIATAAEHGLAVVLGTPTAAPPKWLTEAHPEVLRVEPDGRVCEHGGRGHANPASATYRRFCARIAAAMAERWGSDARVIGWQIDNEYWPFSFDRETATRWHAFLQRRHGDIAALNAAWSNAYWSQDYDRFDQVPLSLGWQNPCLIAALRDFQAEVLRDYQAAQIAAIRRHAGARQWITHNLHGHLQHGDPAILAAELDFASFDPYVGSGHLDPARMGGILDAVRGLKQRPFWVMETQPCTVNWAAVNTALARGEARRMVWHQIAHGAEAVLWWQWRPAHGGQEQLHGSLLHADGRPRPFYAEAAAIGRELAAARTALAGTAPRARVAVLSAWRDRHAIDQQRHHRDFDPWEHVRTWHAALRGLGLDVDIVPSTADLTRYAAVVAPGLYLVDDALARRLADWAAQGGHLLLGARSGFKDGYNALRDDAPPGGALARALGATVQEYYALADDLPLTGCGGSTRRWGEWLQPMTPEVTVLARYGAGHSWLEGQPAVVGRAHGAGWIGLCGAWPDTVAARALARDLVARAGVATPWAELPPGVEIGTRVGARGTVVVLANHGGSTVEIALPQRLHDVLADVGRDRLTLAAGEVAVLAGR